MATQKDGIRGKENPKNSYAALPAIFLVRFDPNLLFLRVRFYH